MVGTFCKHTYEPYLELVLIREKIIITYLIFVERNTLCKATCHSPHIEDYNNDIILIQNCVICLLS